MDRLLRGKAAEERAAAYLAAKGLVILNRNYRFRGGEVDLIARDGATLCFVEVRSRARRDFGTAAATVDRRKQAHIARAAAHYLACRWRGGACACRFDVVAIDEGELTWLRDAFQVAW